MAWLEVTHYGLQYNANGAAIFVRVQGSNIWNLILVKPELAVFVADMLRNEKPMYYDPVNGALGTSAFEPVGEEE